MASIEIERGTLRVGGYKAAIKCFGCGKTKMLTRENAVPFHDYANAIGWVREPEGWYCPSHRMKR